MWTGLGARSVAGRWHSKGVPVVYTSASLALAAVETLVHLDSTEILLLAFVKCPVTFDDSMLEKVKLSNLPSNWRTDPSPPILRRFGDAWVKGARSAVLAVPSCAVPGEWNYVLNRAHRDFSKLSFGKVEPFQFDPRLA